MQFQNTAFYNKNLPLITNEKLINITSGTQNGKKNFMPSSYERKFKPVSNIQIMPTDVNYIMKRTEQPLGKIMDVEHKVNLNLQKSIDFRQIPSIVKSNTILAPKKK